MPALPQLLQPAWTLEKGKLVAFANTAENGHLGKKEWSNNWEQDGNEKDTEYRASSRNEQWKAPERQGAFAWNRELTQS